MENSVIGLRRRIGPARRRRHVGGAEKVNFARDRCKSRQIVAVSPYIE
jgi:hypothetical protein